MNTTTSMGAFLKAAREGLNERTKDHSFRKVAARIGVTGPYVKQIEDGTCSPPTEKTLVALARDLNLDPDLVLAMGGKISSELQAIILKRPQLFTEIIVACKDLPDQAILKLVREVRDGEW